MKPFCELVVQDVLPAVRSIIATELMANLGYTQQEAADKMGVTQPAISQYRKLSRGKKVSVITSDEYVYAYIKSVARKIATEKAPLESHLLCDVCRETRKTGLLCRLHRDAVPALKNCNICMTGKIQC